MEFAADPWFGVVEPSVAELASCVVILVSLETRVDDRVVDVDPTVVVVVSPFTDVVEPCIELEDTTVVEFGD